MAFEGGNLAAHVETLGVEPQFGNRIGSRVEEVARVEGVIASEPPSRSMQRLGPGLDDGADARGRGQTVVGAVVGSELAELGNRVHRGHHAGTAAAAAIIVFTAIDEVDVVAFPQAVEAHVGITARRGGDLEVVLGGNSRMTLRPGQLVGDVSAYSGLASPANVVARSPGTLAKWELRQVREFTASRPELRANLLQMVSVDLAVKLSDIANTGLSSAGGKLVPK